MLNHSLRQRIMLNTYPFLMSSARAFSTAEKVDTSKVNVTLLKRTPCGVCEAASFLLKRVKKTTPFTGKAIPILQHKEFEQYNCSVPVIFINDKLFHVSYRNGPKLRESKIRETLIKEAKGEPWEPYRHRITIKA